jgi:hypothetical protein
MSSQYSPDLRIELIGTGDQAGVWGNTTNTNLGTLMENAVAGYTSVSIIASPQALTANDGAEDQARYAAIALSTVLSNNFTVCIPPNSKLYTFYNASSYTATISNSTVKNGITLSGGATVAIPAGKTMSVWSDGTNVAQQTNNLISPTMSGTPTAPTAAYGTSTTQVANTAFVQAALQALHPVGSIYINASVATNPGTLLGFGTWAAFGAGRVMVGFNAGNTLFDTAEETGGSYDAIAVTHTHTASAGNQSADHTHSFSATTSTTSLTGTFAVSAQANITSGVFSRGTGFSGNGGEPQTNYPINMDASHNHTVSGTTGTVSANHNHAITVDSTGTSGTNANIQPYITVYMWKRTA